MGLVERVRNILINPEAEWTVIEGEVTPPVQVLVGYVLPLALPGAMAAIIGERLSLATVDYQHGVSVTSTVLRAFGGVLVTIAVCAITAFLIDALAPTFGGTKDLPEAFKLAGYSLTPALAAELARPIPFIGGLVGIAGFIYWVYLFYLGVPVLMNSPRDRAVQSAYTAIVIGVAIIATLVLAMMLALFV